VSADKRTIVANFLEHTDVDSSVVHRQSHAANAVDERDGLDRFIQYRQLALLCLPPYWGHFGIARSVRLSVPWRSCLGRRHAGCMQLSHHRPPEMCGLRTRPWTDVDPPRFCIRGRTQMARLAAKLYATVELPSGEGAYRLAARGATPRTRHCADAPGVNTSN